MAKRVPPLSAAQLAKLKPNPNKVIELVDGAVPGLRLRVTPAGTRTWSLNIRAKGVMRRFEVGPELGLKDARDRAEALRRSIREGADPTAKRRTARAQAVSAKKGIGTLGGIIDDYFTEGNGSGLKTRVPQMKRLKAVFSAHLGRTASEVTSVDLQIAIDSRKAKVSAARAVAYMIPVIKWAKKRGLVQGDFDLEKPSLAPPKQRTLSETELADALPTWSDVYGRCCRFLLLTSTRLNEACDATWGQVDLPGATWTIPPEQVKDTRTQAARNRKPKAALVIPLSRQAVELLENVREAELSRRQLNGIGSEISPQDPLFVGERGGRLGNWDRWLKANAKKTGVTGWSAHALRRTAATLAGEIGAPPHIVSVMLGHTNVGGQLVSGYNKSRYVSEHAEVLQKLADYLDDTEKGAKQ
jgi:integrase